jgi:uncharacterized protein (DUF433 family)
MTIDQATLLQRIVKDPEIMVGKPTVRGTRITVEAVLEHLAANPDLDDLFAAYPRLTREDLQACLAYAQTRVARRRSQAAPRATSAVSAGHA